MDIYVDDVMVWTYGQPMPSLFCSVDYGFVDLVEAQSGSRTMVNARVL